ncbi:patatin-like phospholipase family protein [candidate division KSB1 bacterium]|nr:patatin-like phospholipase family protein [candidate division KSB1 bacterium]
MKSFVLSGGSIKGAFQAGALVNILTTGKFIPDAIYGTSVGSLNGSFIADRVGRAIRAGTNPDWVEIGNELKSFWLQNITSFKKLGKKRSVLSQAFALIRNRFYSLLKMDYLYELLAKEIKLENLIAAHEKKLKFYACSVDINSGRIVYASAPQHNNILDYIIASTAIPVVMPLRYLGEHAYTDGGIREVAPLKRAIKDGATDIVAILCSPEDFTTADDNWYKPTNLMERFMAIVTHEICSNDIQNCLEINELLRQVRHVSTISSLANKKHINVVPIYPASPVKIDLEDFTTKDIEIAIQQGWDTVVTVRESADTL